jgi:hypothetical protein
MTPSGTLPPVLRSALAWPGGRCFRHCDRPVRFHRLASRLPGSWVVGACPSGVVSVARYAEWTGRDPSDRVLRQLRRWTRPRTLVRVRDLRLATRHGPELGREAERYLGRASPRRPVRIVYWRLYPFRTRGGAERRLFVCLRRAHDGPIFYAADPAAPAPGCPSGAERRRRRRGRAGRPRSRRRR